MTATRVHLTPHMHWDREWYFTTEASRILLVNNMAEILDRLENDADYPFYVMDGQTAILEDYFAVCPENRPRVKALVEAGKLIIGPWYTQTDTMVVSGESVLRNLLYGMRDCRAFGEPMQIGYLPDSFSMSSQLPHIYQGFGLKHTLFWRGCSERHGTDKTEFRWQSNDGSEVIAQVLPLGYAIGKYLPEDDAALRDRLDKYLPVLESASLTGDVLLPNGHDQMPLQQNIFTVMDTLRRIYPQHSFQLSRFEDIFSRIEAIRPQLPVLRGEFNDGKYMRVHRTISSTRMDIKQANAAIENKIVNVLEPLCSIAWSLGYAYHHGLIEKMWKEIMKNHAHDSIGCCCSDKVHQEILSRFILADDMAENLIQFTLRKIIDNLQPDGHGADRLALFNFSLHPRQETVNTTVRIRAGSFCLTDENGKTVPYFIREMREIDPGLVDRQIVHYGNYDPFMEYDIQLCATLPAMGYVTLNITPNQPGDILLAPAHADALENDYYRVTVNENGTLDILDKQTGQRFQQVLELENGSDDGDEYDYSPARDEWVLTSGEQKAQVTWQHQPWQSSARISLTLPVPRTLEDRAQRRLNSAIPVVFTITLAKNSRRIDVEMTLDNQAEDHRLRVLIPTPFASQTVVADNQFGCITRPVDDPAMAYWEQEGWKEAPVPVWQLMNFAALHDANHGMGLFTQGLREFEITGERRDTFALTLFRAVGVLGKENLLLRPGRPSGIKMPAPDSQMKGTQVYRFALFGFSGDPIQANVMQHARDYQTPVRTYNKMPYDAMKLNPENSQSPLSYSLMQKCISGSVLSVLKKAEDEEALIVRVYNPSETQEIHDSVQVNAAIAEWQEVRMDETVVATANESGSLGEFKPCQSKSFRLRFEH